MTMQQVSKGEFDRKVKLLEQKVQQSANKLMNDYKEFVERVNSVISENGDFNRYAAIVDRINSCFDTNGQFDGSHIAPLSIETSALSVGQRSQALNLKDIRFSIDEYKSSDTVFPNGNLKITNQNGETPSSPNNYGTLTHYTLFNNAQGEPIGDAEFKIEYNVNNPLPSNSHESLVYIYAELPCTKNSSGYIYSSDNNTATIALDTAQRTVESTYNSDHKLSVLLGTISKRFSKTVDSTAYYYRIVDLNYGLTTINGRLITTGRIEGNNTYFDLDNGVIGGNIQFNSAWNTNINSLITSKGYATMTDVNGQKVKSEDIYLGCGYTDRPSTPPGGDKLPSNGIVTATTSGSDQGGLQLNWTKVILDNYNWYYVCTQTYKVDSNGNYIDGSVKFSDIKYDDGISTSARAIKGSTTVNGGLILTSKIQCGSGNATAALSGVGDYAFWAGNTSATNANAWINKDGSAKFGDLNIDNNGLLTFNNSGLKINKKTINYSSIAKNLNCIQSEKAMYCTIDGIYKGSLYVFKLEFDNSVTGGINGILNFKINLSFAYSGTGNAQIVESKQGTSETQLVGTSIKSITQGDSYIKRTNIYTQTTLYVAITSGYTVGSPYTPTVTITDAVYFANEFENGLNIFQNGIAIANGDSDYKSFLFFGYYNNVLYSQNALVSKTGERYDITVKNIQFV